jgi:hypothetical protein
MATFFVRNEAWASERVADLVTTARIRPDRADVDGSGTEQTPENDCKAA